MPLTDVSGRRCRSRLDSSIWSDSKILIGASRTKSAVYQQISCPSGRLSSEPWNGFDPTPACDARYGVNDLPLAQCAGITGIRFPHQTKLQWRCAFDDESFYSCRRSKQRIPIGHRSGLVERQVIHKRVFLLLPIVFREPHGSFRLRALLCQ